jgi:hypothetical protein
MPTRLDEPLDCCSIINVLLSRLTCLTLLSILCVIHPHFDKTEARGKLAEVNKSKIEVKQSKVKPEGEK